VQGADISFFRNRSFRSYGANLSIAGLRACQAIQDMPVLFCIQRFRVFSSLFVHSQIRSRRLCSCMRSSVACHSSWSCEDAVRVDLTVSGHCMGLELLVHTDYLDRALSSASSSESLLERIRQQIILLKSSRHLSGFRSSTCDNSRHSCLMVQAG